MAIRPGLLVTSALALLTLGMILNISEATSSKNGARSFGIDSLLTCNVPVRGESRPEETLRLPLQPGRPGTVWLPVNTTFRRPFGNPNPQRLLEHLGRDFNSRFSALSRPARLTPPIARFFLTVEGSAGSEMLFIPDVIEPNLGDFTDDQRSIIESWIRSQNLGNCPILANWTLLPDTFFPPYLAASYCAANECSFPPGLTCNPDIGEDRVSYITILRWDCCWNFDGNKFWRWDCGWRRVEIPLILDCGCSCQPRLRSPGE